jgi:glycosyltransferase involved in cell wall biosynthesis
MASGVPCVATDVGDTALIVADLGRVVPSRSPEALAGACLELLSMAPRERRALGLAGRQRIRDRYSLREMIRRYEELYQNVAAAQRESVTPLKAAAR